MRALCTTLLALLAHDVRADSVLDDALNPLPQHSYVRLEPSYTLPADTTDVQVRAAFVERGWSGSADSVLGVRADVSLGHAAGTIGLGKVGLLGVAGITWPHGSIGAGLGAALPTATSATFGADDLQLGPAAYGYLAAIEHVPMYLITQTLFATGDSPAIETILEPSLAVQLGDAALLSNASIEIDWLAHDARVPVNLRIGYALDQHWYVEAGPAVVVAGSATGDVTLDAEIDYFL